MADTIKVYGPYVDFQTGRQFVRHIGVGVNRTQSYPRYLMEQKLGRNLEDFEEVDHIDNDPTNDNLDNLQILTKEANLLKQSEQRTKGYFIFFCPICHIACKKPFNHILGNWKKQRNGPFCSKECSRNYQLAPLSQSAEEIALKAIKFGFESQMGHHYITDGEIIYEQKAFGFESRGSHHL